MTVSPRKTHGQPGEQAHTHNLIRERPPPSAAPFQVFKLVRRVDPLTEFGVPDAFLGFHPLEDELLRDVCHVQLAAEALGVEAYAESGVGSRRGS